jgi:hypothetical protein
LIVRLLELRNKSFLKVVLYDLMESIAHYLLYLVV